MRIIESDGLAAVAEGRGVTRRINLFLTGPLQLGTWVLVTHDSAFQVLDDERAAQIDDALDAALPAMAGNAVTGHFPDPRAPADTAPAETHER